MIFMKWHCWMPFSYKVLVVRSGVQRDCEQVLEAGSPQVNPSSVLPWASYFTSLCLMFHHLCRCQNILPPHGIVCRLNELIIYRECCWEFLGYRKCSVSLSTVSWGPLVEPVGKTDFLTALLLINWDGDLAVTKCLLCNSYNHPERHLLAPFWGGCRGTGRVRVLLCGAQEGRGMAEAGFIPSSR